jgi:exodeoxyribonuclease VII large subunit
MHNAAGRSLGEAGRLVAAEHRALERLHPAATLAAARERAGGLLDRATRGLVARLADARRREERLADRLAPIVPARLAFARGQLAASGAALAALGPAATLERGYAIVRRQADGAIVREPSEAPSGTRLRIRVARGEFPADVSKPDA